jgi:predicted nucleotidyltransferase component of viral defense system
MIDQPEIRAHASQWSVRDDVIQKDYALGWLLDGIANNAALNSWVFKGGTCLRKCYYETYRFSEDLDFTIVDGGPESPDELVTVFSEIGAYVYDACGLTINVDQNSFRRTRNKRHHETTTGAIEFSTPLLRGSAPKIKIDLTSDEVVVLPTEFRDVYAPYSDSPQPATQIRSYSLVELMAEKTRALQQRCRPRDLYDIIHTYRHRDLLGRASDVHRSLSEKCAHVGIEIPTQESIQADRNIADLKREWQQMLDHQLPKLPPFDEFWNELGTMFEWLNGRLAIAVLPQIDSQDGDEVLLAHRLPPRQAITWRVKAPLDLIRFAGANRLKLTVDYRETTGRSGPRLVEPYSLRLTRDGDVVLYVVDDNGEPCSYRVDQMEDVDVSDQPFTPRFQVEFS